jgi:hypothetical protein
VLWKIEKKPKSGLARSLMYIWASNNVKFSTTSLSFIPNVHIKWTATQVLGTPLLQSRIERTKMSIQPIPKQSVHRLVAGQAVCDLTSAVKELVENAIDAGATRVCGELTRARAGASSIFFSAAVSKM